MRLIDADELQKFPIRIDHYDTEHGNLDFILGIETALEYADNMPTIDAEPIKHGRWVQRRNGKYYCINCGREERFIFQKNYCPNCGAKMDGGVEDEH